ncbi:carbohydrate kinase family protein [Gracilinema caldarium]|uniref:carbohydrate kinase family protein n=1 Tax=Gracilinema caldarium TaxID=215591 RepID=UPI0026F0EE1E|nr:carbohydrate kinase family protein [Gracilinema caldarium]
MTIHGTGCCLIDYLYSNVDFFSPEFLSARSCQEGDGGLTPGKLIFAEEFERFMGKPYQQDLELLTKGVPPNRYNLGGPAVVSLAHTAQMLTDPKYQVVFYGVCGNDDTAILIKDAIARIPFKAVYLKEKPGQTPRTDVLSDPTYDNGHGERTFINLLGVAAFFIPDDLPEDFFNADIITFGGTALLPNMHNRLTELLKESKHRGSLTFVNLVYDFQNELQHPGKKWTIGNSDDAYPYIDILVADREEALKTSGTSTMSEAISYFLNRGTGAVVITEGAKQIHIGAIRPRNIPYRTMPVCEAVNQELIEHPERRGDTTGCGDNFAGGLLANVAEQLETSSLMKKQDYDLEEACVWANAAGGFTCFVIGGTYYENKRGEKRERILSYVSSYREQLKRSNIGDQL